MIQRALIVDDDPRVMARAILKGFHVVLARSGDEAMAIMTRADRVRAVISDRDLGRAPTDCGSCSTRWIFMRRVRAFS